MDQAGTVAGAVSVRGPGSGRAGRMTCPIAEPSRSRPPGLSGSPMAALIIYAGAAEVGVTCPTRHIRGEFIRAGRW